MAVRMSFVWDLIRGLFERAEEFVLNLGEPELIPPALIDPLLQNAREQLEQEEQYERLLPAPPPRTSQPTIIALWRE